MQRHKHAGGFLTLLRLKDKLRSPAQKKKKHHPPPQKSPSHTNPDISSEQKSKEKTDKNKRDGIPGLPYTAANMRIKPKKKSKAIYF